MSTALIGALRRSLDGRRAAALQGAALVFGGSSLAALGRLAYETGMDETARPRKTLSLKSGVAPPVAAPPPPEAAKEVWKCKPCGAVVDLDNASPDAPVRCAACGARLGKLEDFLSGIEAPKVRARKAVLAPPPPAPPPPAPEIKARPKIMRPT